MKDSWPGGEGQGRAGGALGLGRRVESWSWGPPTWFGNVIPTPRSSMLLTPQSQLG